MPNVTGGARDSFGGSAGAHERGAASRDGAAAAGRAAAGGNQYAGYKGPVGTRAPTTAAPGSYGLSGDETRAYNSAKSEYLNRGLGKRILDFLSPLKSVNPQINQPASYAAGQYHHGFNPLGLAVGAIAPYGSGTVLGPLAGSAYSAMGGHDVVVTGPGSGFSTSYPDGGPGYNSMTGYAGGPADQTGPAGVHTENGGHIPGPVQPPTPQIFAPQKPVTPPVQPQQPPIFIPPQYQQSQYQVPGGSPYGFSIFGQRTA